jgi:hypothetical protein
MKIFKLERILNHQQHLHFNVKWTEDDYYDSGVIDRRETIKKHIELSKLIK